MSGHHILGRGSTKRPFFRKLRIDILDLKMPKKVNPRRGTMQLWPRKRAKRETARVRSWPSVKETGLLGFAGYKAGMTHVLFTDNSKTSLTKGQEITSPVTIIECPPLKVASVRFYKNDKVLKTVTNVLAEKLDKELSKILSVPKKTKKKIDDVNADSYDKIHFVVYTQPKMTGIGKKKPELFEIALGGTKEEQLNLAKEKLGNEIKIEEVIKEGQLVDIHAITRGKGTQGPVKRFGVKIREHKSEKTKRGPGSLGPWKGQGHVMWRVPQAGKMGYNVRTEYNKWILKYGNDAKEINPKGGFVNYGFVKNDYVLLKGSVAGPKKRLIRFTFATRAKKGTPSEAPSIEYISLESKQR